MHSMNIQRFLVCFIFAIYFLILSSSTSRLHGRSSSLGEGKKSATESRG